MTTTKRLSQQCRNMYSCDRPFLGGLYHVPCNHKNKTMATITRPALSAVQYPGGSSRTLHAVTTARASAEAAATTATKTEHDDDGFTWPEASSGREANQERRRWRLFSHSTPSGRKESREVEFRNSRVLYFMDHTNIPSLGLLLLLPFQIIGIGRVRCLCLSWLLRRPVRSVTAPSWSVLGAGLCGMQEWRTHLYCWKASVRRSHTAIRFIPSTDNSSCKQEQMHDEARMVLRTQTRRLEEQPAHIYPLSSVDLHTELRWMASSTAAINAAAFLPSQSNELDPADKQNRTPIVFIYCGNRSSCVNYGAGIGRIL